MRKALHYGEKLVLGAALAFALAVVLMAAGHAQQAGHALPPDALVRQITDQVLASVRSDPDLQGGDRAKLSALVRAQVLPHFDFARATAIAVGPRWRTATLPQREALTREFETLLVRTYSVALASYRDQTIVVLPVHMAASDTEVTVRSQIRQSGTAPITLEYTMAREGGDWKVFDIAVDGLSLVANYRNEFNQVIEQGGIDGLISRLAAKNAGA